MAEEQRAAFNGSYGEGGDDEDSLSYWLLDALEWNPVTLG
jgi:hypothetical protein